MIVGSSLNVAPEATWQFSDQCMVKHKSSSAALNDLLSATSDSEESNSDDEFSENQADLDCEVIECNETNNDDNSPAET